MKTLFVSAVLILLSLCAHTQEDKTIIIGKKEVIHSAVLNENRKIWIYTPDMSSHYTNPEKRYPVLYLLDGDAHFFSTVGIVQQLSQANGNGVLPEMIVVAIENTNRLRDLVPPDDINKTNPFVDFLSAELMPHIDKNYKTAPYKLLAGHSLGGLTAINILSQFPDLFNACIAIDPSMWYSNEKIMKNISTRLSKQKIKERKLFVGIANTMPPGMSLAQLKKDKSAETQHIRSIFKFDSFLKANASGLLYAKKYYESDRHNTVPLISEYDGLRFIFDYYHLDATEKDFTDPSASIAAKLKRHYTKVSEKLGYKNAAPESLINYLAYEALGKKQYDKAGALFELNIESYPESNNANDSYADYFLVKKDTANAITHYKKALELKEDAATRAKLNALLKKEEPLSENKVDLRKYAGVYLLEMYGVLITLEMRNNKLWAKVAGEEDDELQLISENVFTVKGKQGYTITFQMDGEKPKEFISVQPNGTFKAVFKNK